MDQQELKNVLELHRKWVVGEESGKRADLSSADLSYADLSSVNLSSADLSYADLSYADLSSVNLSYADLSSANLSSANLSSANLSSAYLSYADLRYANLSSADLSSANLSRADLSSIKDDFLKRLKIAKAEAIGLYDALTRGKVLGTSYEGECACFVGTIANIRKEKFKELAIDLRPDAESLTEKWFLGIKDGDTPQSNPISKITREWIEEFAKANELVIPQYKLISSLEEPGMFK